ncbi:polysaccharide export protein [Oculatella sp. LEGE 06141]|uniref:polysaccharide biosynthesis/export family protein n=1 Tax=Oculatella sp. LEGE 06141 TaxID=1828648 RepID=UPI001882B4BA|nr:polysaccharide biosynthesis/export family protein [Oculatella sp. LEGE 06141]MBE9181393.1 polysaccharide export protein [Oculatella sp. LEGE 06141]
MPQVPRPRFYRFSLLTLTGGYFISSVFPLAIVVGAVAAYSPAPVLGQTPPNAAPPSDRPTSRELLEQARQRLINRGELSVPPQEPNSIPIPVQSPPPDNAAFDSYRLGPGDGIFVNVFRFPDLSFQGTVDLQGNIVVPLAGVLSLDGLTVSQAQERIQTAFDRYVVNPQVEITLVAQRPVEVTVIGEVSRPGFYPLLAPQLTTALFSAGGTTRLADMRNVLIRRTLTDGAVIERNIDFYTPLQNLSAVPDVRLEDGDTIIVPALTSETSGDYDRNLIANSTLAQPVINVRVLNYAANAGTRGRGGQLGIIQLPNGSRFVDALVSIAPDVSNANLSSIALIRFDVDQGKAVSQQIDGRDAIRGDSSQNPLLEHNDVVVIGRSFVSRITYALSTFTQPFRDVLGFLLFFDTLRDSADNLFGPTDD